MSDKVKLLAKSTIELAGRKIEVRLVERDFNQRGSRGEWIYCKFVDKKGYNVQKTVKSLKQEEREKLDRIKESLNTVSEEEILI